MSRVRYSTDEQRQIIHTAFLLGQKMPLATPLSLWQTTQEYLPASRRRQADTPSDLPPWFKAGLEALREAWREGQTTPLDVLPKARHLVPVIEAKGGDERVLVKTKLVDGETTLDDINDTLRGISSKIDRLITQMAKLIETTEVLARAWADEIVEEPVQVIAHEPRVSKPVVVILGAQMKQLDLLKQEYPQLIIRGTKRDNEVGPMVRYSDHIIVWSDFASHSLERIARSAMPKGATYAYVSGGMTALRAELQRYLEETNYGDTVECAGA